MVIGFSRPRASDKARDPVRTELSASIASVTAQMSCSHASNVHSDSSSSRDIDRESDSDTDAMIKGISSLVRIRAYVRNGRIASTTVEGLCVNVDPKNHKKVLDTVLRKLKKELKCFGVVEGLYRDDFVGGILRIGKGDQRLTVKEALIKLEVCTEEAIAISGA